jgi:hypothetical protein
MPSPTKPTNSTAYTDVLTELKELLPFNYIGGLITSNDGGDTAHDVNITAGECRDPTDVASLRLASEITKQIDAAWAVGDDAGGMDAGAVAADTLYAVWLIKRSDTGVVDALFSTSFTAPTMPANYDYKRLIGAVMTDGASDIIAFTQSGDYFRYTGDTIADVSDSTITNVTWEDGTLSVPPSCEAVIGVGLDNPTSTAGIDGQIFIKPKGAADGFTLIDTFMDVHFDTDNFETMGRKGRVLVDANRKIEYAAVESTGSATVYIYTIGFNMLTRREP